MALRLHFYMYLRKGVRVFVRFAQAVEAVMSMHHVAGRGHSNPIAETISHNAMKKPMLSQPIREKSLHHRFFR